MPNKLIIEKVETQKGIYYEVLNKKKEYLGLISFYRDWNEYVWEQKVGIIMSASCLIELSKFMEKLK